MNESYYYGGGRTYVDCSLVEQVSKSVMTSRLFPMWVFTFTCYNSMYVCMYYSGMVRRRKNNNIGSLVSLLLH